MQSLIYIMIDLKLMMNMNSYSMLKIMSSIIIQAYQFET